MISTSPISPGQQPSVQVAGVNHSFGQGELAKQVLFNNQLSLFPGEIVIMTGPSGSGKTTLLTLIGGLRTVQQGSLKVLGEELSGMSASDLIMLRRNIGFIFQAHNLFSSLSAQQNVRMSLELSGASDAEMKSQAVEMLERLGLGHRVGYKPGQLSGGQRQRVAIARALVNRPKLILADEPTAALDKQSGRDVVSLLEEFAKTEQATILMVTHDNRILDVADRIVNMVDGQIISDVVVNESVEKCEALRTCAPFARLTPATISQVADNMQKQSYAPGEVIVRQGEEGDKFYVIQSGEVDVSIREDNRDRKVASLKPGEFFGEASLLTGEPRNATVTAAGDVEVFTLAKPEFQAVIDQSASFGEELRTVLFQRI